MRASSHMRMQNACIACSGVSVKRRTVEKCTQSERLWKLSRKVSERMAERTCTAFVAVACAERCTCDVCATEVISVCVPPCGPCGPYNVSIWPQFHVWTQQPIIARSASLANEPTKLIANQPRDLDLERNGRDLATCPLELS